jgi:hypothetical protein
MKLRNLPIILGFLVLLLTLPTAVFWLQQRQQIRVAAGVPTTTLIYLWPQKFSLSPGQETILEVKVDSQGQAARRAEATIKFNPNLIKIDKESIIAPEGISLAQSVLNEADGVLQLSGVGDFENKNTLASFTMQALAQGSATVQITSAHLWDPTGQTDIFGRAMGAEITIK